jgi:hypothetical protein
MKILRYGEKVIGVGPTVCAPGGEPIRCSTADCTEASEIHAELRGASKRTIEFCAKHMEQARNSDLEFDYQIREFLARERAHPASA